MTVFSPWQARAWAQAMAALDAGRLPHALLVGGPAGLGKRALVRALARRLLCASPHDGHACGQCRGCALVAAGTHPDLIEETFEPNDKGELRKEILIGQVRRLGEKLALTPQIAAAQVALIHPAEAMNRSAFNALLKTLEEPAAGRYLILVADQPQRLPATIRSRCQALRLDLPPRAEALAWLVAQGLDARAAAEALDAAQGNPGLAREYLAGDALALRRAVARELVELAAGRTDAAELSVAWSGDRPALRLRFAGELVRDHLAVCAGADRPDLLSGAGPVAPAAPLALAGWFDQAARALRALDGPLRDDLQMAELLVAWKRLFAPA